MKRFRWKNGLIFASWAMLLIFGCHKKKPPIPAQEPPPEVSTTKAPETPQQPQTQQPTQNPPTQEQPQTATNNPQDKPSPKHPKHPPAPKKPTPATAEQDKTPTEVAKNSSPPRIVIKEGGTSAVGSSKIDGGNETAASQATTQQLIDIAEANLRSIKRQLSTDEQTTVSQIRDLIKQSKDASKDGDQAKAHNLALKARLFSDELVKAK
ncbi:MAG TPA: hypothetical protein VJA94_09995 [Candidatus Angelobacter sp.]